MSIAVTGGSGYYRDDISGQGSALALLLGAQQNGFATNVRISDGSETRDNDNGLNIPDTSGQPGSSSGRNRPMGAQRMMANLTPLTTIEGRAAMLVKIGYPEDQQDPQRYYTLLLYSAESSGSARETEGILGSLVINGQQVGEKILEHELWKSYVKSTTTGQPMPEREVSSAPLPAETPPVSASTVSSMGDLVQKHQNSLVLFEGKIGAGSGFVVKGPQGDLVYTNTHVVAADQGLKIRTMGGSNVSIGAAEAAVDHDETRFRLADGAANFATLEVLENVNETIKVGDEVAVLGNSEGAGVVRALAGQIEGIGPDRIEINAQFIPGNSGSPVIHVPTGKVIGIATYIMVHDTSFDGNGSSSSSRRARNFRRFAYRLDSVKEWQPVNWPVFYKQSAELNRSEQLTENVFRLVMSMSRQSSNGPDGSDDPLLRPVIAEFNRAVSGSQRLSESDRKTAVGRLFAGLKSASEKELGPARPQGYYDFFIDGFETQRKARKELVSKFDEVLGNVGRY